MRNLSILRYPVIALAILCTACGAALPTINAIKPYKLDVQQGNVVTSKMLLQLRPGMTKSQVRFIMGTPLIQDSFHGNRWDYVYQMRESGKLTEQRRVILDFENELLKTVRGDVVPSGGEQAKAAEPAATADTRAVEPQAKSEDKNIIGMSADEVALAAGASAVKFNADEKQAAAKEAPVVKESAIPAEEVKSILAVPVEVLALPEAPARTAPVAAATVTSASVAPVASPATPKEVPVVKPPVAVAPPVVAATSIETPKAVVMPVAQAPVQKKSVEKAVEAPQAPVVTEAVAEPVNAPSYVSSTGMMFENTLGLVPAEVVPEAKPVVVAPRAGNTAVPKPKELPAEAPGFFDKMLEKIGF